MITPGKLNFVIYQGCTLRKSLIWTTNNLPVDLTGYSGRSQIRKTIDSTAVVLELSTLNGGILITPSTGEIVMYASDTDTETLTEDRYVYDLELTNATGDVFRIVEGMVTISRGVTR